MLKPSHKKVGRVGTNFRESTQGGRGELRKEAGRYIISKRKRRISTLAKYYFFSRENRLNERRGESDNQGRDLRGPKTVITKKGKPEGRDFFPGGAWYKNPGKAVLEVQIKGRETNEKWVGRTENGVDRLK